ncbi:MAG: NAD(P)-dependent oxidoreductase [Gemmatimonadaceae bacterium]|nr:NAD(P)-dependent oxidoreductase [Gemmatimonadaceae bacterium]
MSSVTVLGTGLLGSAFAEGLLSRGGSSVTVWNRTRGKAEPLAALGARIADTPSDAVRGADRVHLVLLDDDAVDATIAELRPGLSPNAVIIDHTTTLPARTAARVAALDAVGVAYLHAPVMMGPPAARSAKGMMLVAGSNERVARVHDGLSAMTGELWHVGERADLAAVYKLVGNAMVLSLIGTVADIMHLVDSAGVPRSGAMDMLAKTNPAGAMAFRGAMMRDNQFDTNFALDVARKDVRLMLETASAQPVPLLRALAQRMDTLIADGEGGKDFAVLGRRETKGH